ncbi:hypothetical protein BSKO_06725 [Bryopsis sp. KO-2023]|nr:hypothetical protein BSKO_06725 [Bryopsis sp. KO-2023]
MVKSALCIALVALLCASGLAVDCPGAADPSCNAFASLEIFVTAGNCKGQAGADCEGDSVVAESLCTGDATSGTEEKIIESGDVCGGATQLIACSGPGKAMCCASDFKKSFCKCENCVGPWIKKDPTEDGKKVFENKSNQKCFCA